VEIRWFVGLGAGTTSNQQAIQRNVVQKFNDSHPNIRLTLEVVDYSEAVNVLVEQMASGDAADIIGPMGWHASNTFHEEWFDLSALIVDTNYDLSQFNPELVAIYKTDEGQIGLPFAVYPAAVFYNKRIIDKAGMAYPPANYGEMYTMPDGSQVEWDWNTLTEVARRLTLDQAGRNATEDGFDREKIVQYGYVPQYQGASSIASFWGAGKLYDENNNAVIPAEWQEVWKWYYFGMWGSDPFIPNQAAINTPRFGGGNAFASSNIAMAITQSWYISPNVAGGNKWDLAALPAYNGKINGRVDADTFRIWKGTEHPREAFEVLTYFIGPASEDLLRAYGGIPARLADQDAFFAARAKQYSWVKNWDVLRAGLSYPDNPSAEGYMPNFLEAWNRLTAFGNLLVSTDNISVNAEIETLRRDLDNIFNR
jgi:multiple sugar transport system substrate-binding protein